VKDATADYSDEMMHAALDINLPKGKVVVSPLLGFFLALLLVVAVSWALSTRRRPAATQNRRSRPPPGRRLSQPTS
jgi:hypothetical protein